MSDSRIDWTAFRAAPDVIGLAIPDQLRAAEQMGRLIAAGQMRREEALAALLAAARQAAPHLDPSGTQARLTWALDDAAREETLRQAREERQAPRRRWTPAEAEVAGLCGRLLARRRSGAEVRRQVTALARRLGLTDEAAVEIVRVIAARERGGEA